MRLTSQLAMATLLAAGLAAGAATADTAPGRMTLTGEGIIASAPDMAKVTLGVQTLGATAAEALDRNSADVAAVLARLQAAGIAARDLQTTGLSLGPQLDHRRDGQAPTVVGYEAQNSVTARVRDLAMLGNVLDQAVKDGANTLYGLSFGLSDPQTALDAARKAAVTDALRKARLMAEAAGVTLGPLVEMSEQGHMPAPGPMYRSAPMALEAAVPIESGEVRHAVTVTMTWTIGQP